MLTCALELSLLTASKNARRGIVSQNISFLGDTVTLGYDWQFNATSPRSNRTAMTLCTLATSVGPVAANRTSQALQAATDGWTRPDTGFGGGHVETTLSFTNKEIGDNSPMELRFEFFCSSSSYLAGAMIDNLDLRAC